MESSQVNITSKFSTLKKFAAKTVLVASLIGCSNCQTRENTPSAQPKISDQKIQANDASTSSHLSGTCTCMECTRSASIFGKAIENLIGGSCNFDANCDPTVFANLQNGSVQNKSVRTFMVGQGPTFSDFSNANQFCGDRLNMAVQWLQGSANSEYQKPSPQRAMCLLSKDVMPVYILYSHGTNISATGAANVASILGNGGRNEYNGQLSSGPVGPSIVVTEMNFDASQASQVADQVRAVDLQCNDRQKNQTPCLIAVGPKIGDTNALDAVMKSLGKDSNKVDLVAYGIDGNFTHTCDPNSIMLQALNFSRYALYNWSKPTLSPYILFDRGGHDADKSCTWSEDDVASAYASLFSTGLPMLQKSGVIGVASYSFGAGNSSIVNPLHCNDCGLNVNKVRLNSWFGSCAQYTTVQTSPIVIPVGGNASSSSCNEGFNAAHLANFNLDGGDIMQPQAPQNTQNFTKYFSCDACLTSNIVTPVTALFNFPTMITATKEMCTQFPEIDQWASARNLDPMLVRAFVATESNFDPFAAAKVCSYQCVKSHCTNGCFHTDITGASMGYFVAYDEIYDPAGARKYQNAAIAHNPEWRWLSFGLMQGIEPPYTFWPAQYSPTGADGQYYDIYSRSGFFPLSTLAAAKTCSPTFNPFSPDDSLCLGTLKLEGMLQQAHTFINSNRSQLGWPSTDLDKDNVFAAYIVGNMYSGEWGTAVRSANFVKAYPSCSSSVSNGECWTNSFFESRTVDATYCSSSSGAGDKTRCNNGAPRQEAPYYCYGYTDFVKFVHDCRLPFSTSKMDEGAHVMGMYATLVSSCQNNFCPDGKVFGAALGLPVPPSGSYYAPESNKKP